MVQGGREGGGGAKENRRMNGKTGFENYLIIGRNFLRGKKLNRFGSREESRFAFFLPYFHIFLILIKGLKIKEKS